MNSQEIASFYAKDLQPLQALLGYYYKDIVLLQSALLHPSCFRHEPSPLPFRTHFQRLEFLGDRFLSATLGAKLFELFPNEREGFLSKAYMILSQECTLVKLAERLELRQYLKVDQPEIANSILADAVEAIIGSLWLDSDYLTASEKVLNWFGDIRSWVLSELKTANPKGQLQELLKERFHELHYELLDTWGPEHKRQFRCAVYLNEELLADGEGFSRQSAEESAAEKALVMLKQARH